MNLIKMIQKAIHHYKHPSDKKLFDKAKKLYCNFARYHTLQHTLQGYHSAVETKTEMYKTLCGLYSMPEGPYRREMLKETIKTFKAINRIGFC